MDSLVLGDLFPSLSHLGTRLHKWSVHLTAKLGNSAITIYMCTYAILSPNKVFQKSASGREQQINGVRSEQVIGEVLVVT